MACFLNFAPNVLFSLLFLVALQYQLTIRSGHKLIQSGPYTYLLHPGYTGTALNCLGALTLLYLHGMGAVYVTYIAKWTYQVSESGFPSSAPLRPCRLLQCRPILA